MLTQRIKFADDDTSLNKQVDIIFPVITKKLKFYI